ncbi:dynein axonemal light chain 1-like [Babylonia areolata]|uniref:dynein axonemal light chain 1-like n=1 Tax=Babylonia areolata TaxID=304850 RepID=UPI003FD435DD
MNKACTTKDALAKWQERTGIQLGEATEVKLCGMNPPLEKMDNGLGQLTKCEKLSLSSNCIEKIAFLTNLRNLKILSVGRNSIKSFAGLEAVGDVLEELWISYNNIERMKGVNVLKKLRVLYMSNNLVKDMGEVSRLNDLPNLKELVMVGNPIEETLSAEDKWRDVVGKALSKIAKLDGSVVLRREG